MVMAEKVFHIEDKIDGNRLLGAMYRAFILFVIILLWILFRAENAEIAIRYIQSLFLFETVNAGIDSPWMYFWELKFELLACTLLSFTRLSDRTKNSALFQSARAAALLVLFVVSVSYLVKGTFSPFLYFNF